MQISEVQFVPVKPDNGLIGFASCVLEGQHYIGSIAVFTKLSGGYRLVYPTKIIGGRHLHYHHPISKEAGEAIEHALIARVEEVLS
jgi:stage V sporulation protein G